MMPRLETAPGQSSTAKHSAKKLALLLRVEGSSPQSCGLPSPFHSLMAAWKVVSMKIPHANCWCLF